MDQYLGFHQLSAFLLVGTRSLASRGAWFSGSACVGRGSPNGLSSSRAGRAWLHGLHAHRVGGGLEQEGLERPLLVPGERHHLGRGHQAGSIWRRRSNYRGTAAMKPRWWPAASMSSSGWRLLPPASTGRLQSFLISVSSRSDAAHDDDFHLSSTASNSRAQQRPQGIRRISACRARHRLEAGCAGHV